MATDRDQRASEMIERWNRVFRALTAEPRRQIIVTLIEAPPERQLSLPEAANPPYQLRDPEELHVALVHTHLPVLAECGFVEWERDPLSVERGPAFDEVATVFEALQSYAGEIPQRLTQECQRLEESGKGRS